IREALDLLHAILREQGRRRHVIAASHGALSHGDRGREPAALHGHRAGESEKTDADDRHRNENFDEGESRIPSFVLDRAMWHCGLRQNVLRCAAKWLQGYDQISGSSITY